MAELALGPLTLLILSLVAGSPFSPDDRSLRN